MCRLFGFRALSPSAVHRSLVLESNALRRQSREHPDGWGLAFYVGGVPQVARGVDGAFADEDFENLCHFISSDTVVGHVRKASVGPLSLENTHPFEHGPWVLAHNGTIPDFGLVAPVVEQRLAPAFRERLRGDTDSERLFWLFMTHLERRVDPLASDVPMDAVLASLEDAVHEVLDACHGRTGDPSLNVIVTNGRLMAAFRRGRTLHFSTYKHRCPERERCSAYTPRCESPVPPGEVVSHFLVASEPIGTDDAWVEVEENHFVGVDAGMRLVRRSLEPRGRGCAGESESEGELEQLAS